MNDDNNHNNNNPANELPVDHKALRKDLADCESIGEFREAYDSAGYQLVLHQLRTAQGTDDVDEWAKQWATRMRNAGKRDLELNECRKTALTLVYQLCDRWRDPEYPIVSDQSLVQEFKGRRFSNILQLTLPMDRAQCLYKMVYPGSRRFGMHWVASQHLDQATPSAEATTWKDRIKAVGGISTMNRRFLWLMSLDGLELGAVPAFKRWTQPEPAPWFDDCSKNEDPT